MPSQYDFINNAVAKVAAARPAGVPALVVDDAGPFVGVEFPIRLSVLRYPDGGPPWGVPVAIFKAVSLSGSTFTLDGTLEGFSDADCLQDDVVMIGWTAGAADELWDAVDAEADGGMAIGAAVAGATDGRLLLVSSGGLAQSANLTFDGDRLAIGPHTPTAGVDVGGGAGVVIRNSVGSVASSFDSNGYGFVDRMTFQLAWGFELLAANNLTGSGAVAGFAGVLSKVKIQAATNGGSGGFTLRINKNGSSIFTTNPAVAAGATTVQTFVPTSASMAEGDVYTIDCTSAGIGVQNVVVTLFALVRNA